MTRTANPADRLACEDPIAYPTPAGGATGIVDAIHYAPGGIVVNRITVRTDDERLLTFPAADVEALEEEPCGDCGRPVYYDETFDTYRHAVEPMRGCFLIRAHDGVADYPIMDELAARGITNLVAPLEAEGFRIGQTVARHNRYVGTDAVGTVVAFNSRPAGYLVGVRFVLTPSQTIVRYFPASELEAR